MNNENTQSNTAIVEIGLDKLKIHPKNVRQSYEGIEELTASIKENGILQNLTVVPDPEDEGTYFAVIGNRRLTAAREAGFASAPCRIADMEEAEQVIFSLPLPILRNWKRLAISPSGTRFSVRQRIRVI